MLFLNFFQYFQQKSCLPFMHLFLWTYNISQINFHVVYLASSHLPLHFELPLVQVKSQNHVFFLIFAAFLNMPEVNLQMKRRVLSTRSHSTYSEIQFHLQDLNFSLIIMMTKITDNGIRFIIMIPLTVQPFLVFWLFSFEFHPLFIIMVGHYLRIELQLNLDYSDSHTSMVPFFQQY